MTTYIRLSAGALKVALAEPPMIDVGADERLNNADFLNEEQDRVFAAWVAAGSPGKEEDEQ